ncbi:hypothetical protein [Deinococcus cellulosilyticus]|uniref:Uncharacterized protein n=1 Tax=Deinococcus cellulosilyticus (strain DSM 18568 / NBRC 106333 / KACC 11606 / 5516J-15) TaxID=1223518 RepID=A0A511N775_DEIC1|nr:hypothetical protein [Deinococcus cellulosilyticus]GEM48702.1 hypothetical protein DC3_43370 [Deinococcus cellulosilyticus NBRC 106333 = KACC 11606]
MSSKNQALTADEQHAQGEAILERARTLFAKAQQAQPSAQPTEEDLEDDFDAYDNPEAEDGTEQEDEEDTPQTNPAQKPGFAKAASVHVGDDGTEYVDVTEQFAQMNRQLRQTNRMVKAQQVQIKQLLEVVGLQQGSLEHMAKAQGNLLSTPRTPKSRVSVPTGVTQQGKKVLDRKEIYAKADQAILDPVRFAQFEQAFSRGDLETAKQALTAAERAEIFSE